MRSLQTRIRPPRPASHHGQFVTNDPITSNLEADTQTTRAFTCNGVTGDLTHTPGGYWIENGERFQYLENLEVALADGNLQILQVGANRNVVQLEVDGGVGMEGQFSAEAGGPVSLAFSNENYEIDFNTHIVEPGLRNRGYEFHRL